MLAFLLAAAALTTGCATGPHPRQADPFESFNRRVFEFNDAVDEAVLRPTAEGYRKVVPQVMRSGVNNFFGNLADAWSFVNSVAQLKLRSSTDNFMRVSVNTVFGIGGLFDVASDMSIDRHPEDFGQTLGRWGVPAGPFLVLPLLGPSTVRDTAALPVDRSADLINMANDVALRTSLYGLRLVDTRSNLLRAGQLLNDAALDKYSFTRDAFLQRRRSEVYDGNPPEDDDYDR